MEQNKANQTASGSKSLVSLWFIKKIFVTLCDECVFEC